MKLCKISSVRVAIRKLNHSQVGCITCISINKLSFFGKQGERGTESGDKEEGKGRSGKWGEEERVKKWRNIRKTK